MTRRIGVLLVLTALLGGGRAALADHVWRIWCGTPPTRRASVFDTSEECHRVTIMMLDADDVCRDTRTGPRWVWNGKLTGNVVRGHRTCAEFVADRNSCVCKPEVVE